MDVAHRPRDLSLRHLEDARLERGVQVPAGPRLDPGIPALLNEWRQPADLELSADHDKEIRALELEDEARLGFDEVRILITARNRFNRHTIAADLPPDRREIFGRRDHVELGLRAGGNRRGCDQRGQNA